MNPSPSLQVSGLTQGSGHGWQAQSGGHEAGLSASLLGKEMVDYICHYPNHCAGAAGDSGREAWLPASPAA